jgi:hypothetical protein
MLRGERSSSGNATHPGLPREGVRTRLPCALPCQDRESAPRRRLLEQGFTAGQLGHLVFTGLPNRPNLFQVKITAAPRRAPASGSSRACPGTDGPGRWWGRGRSRDRLFGEFGLQASFRRPVTDRLEFSFRLLACICTPQTLVLFVETLPLVNGP